MIVGWCDSGGNRGRDCHTRYAACQQGGSTRSRVRFAVSCSSCLPSQGRPVSQNVKLQRWIDLVAVLLGRHYGATLAELRRSVPGYARGRAESVRRTFERDKDELRRLGVPIITSGEPGDAGTRYLLRPGTFYLPYLAIVTERGLKRPAKVDRYGYRAVENCEFTPEQLELLADAATCAADLGDPVLATDARNAVAKLALDVDRDSLTPTPNLRVYTGTAASDAQTVTTLSDALLRRKQVSFTYYGIERDETERRTIFPYGLTYTGGHWYLHGHDPSRGAARRFRVSRIRELAVNPRTPGSPDFEVPGSFNLRELARAVTPWQLDTEEEPVEATLQFSASHGAARAARKLGTTIRGEPDKVRYRVRRRETFLRWVLGLAGDARPVAPPDLVREYESLVARTLAASER